MVKKDYFLFKLLKNKKKGKDNMGIILCAFGLGLVIQGICYCRGQGSFSSKWWITILLVVMSLFFGVFIPGDYYDYICSKCYYSEYEL